MQRHLSSCPSLPRIVSAGLLFALFGCNLSNDEIAEISYVCGEEPEPEPGGPRCGEGDPRLPPEPTVPQDPTDADCILKANRIEPPEGQVLPEPLDPAQAMMELDGVRINAALGKCSVVKLVK